MRLIDADKVKEYIRTEGFYCDNQADKEYTVNQFDELFPTVKAIPIEWLHSIMKKQLIFAMESEMEGKITVQDGVIHCVSGAVACQVLANVIELWEEENETNAKY